MLFVIKRFDEQYGHSGDDGSKYEEIVRDGSLCYAARIESQSGISVEEIKENIILPE